jgi:hypothetical protein
MTGAPDDGVPEHEEPEAGEVGAEPEPEPAPELFEPEEETEDIVLGAGPDLFEPDEAEVEHAEGVVEDYDPEPSPQDGPEPAPAPQAVSPAEPGPAAGEEIVENFEPEPEPCGQQEPAPEPEPGGASRRVRRSRKSRDEQSGGGFGDGIL